LSTARKTRKAAAMKRPSGKRPDDTGSGPPRSGTRLAQYMLIVAVLALIVIAAVQFS
jgi:hypothetical protein